MRVICTENARTAYDYSVELAYSDDISHVQMTSEAILNFWASFRGFQHFGHLPVYHTKKKIRRVNVMNKLVNDGHVCLRFKA